MDQCLVGKRALLVVQDGSWYFPAMMRKVYKGSTFGQTGDFADAEANYRELKNRQASRENPPLLSCLWFHTIPREIPPTPVRKL